MTGSIGIVLPAMLAVGIACLIIKQSDATIYKSQLGRREEEGRGLRDAEADAEESFGHLEAVLAGASRQ
jgi:H+/Cl- antiporter ClcA